MLTLHSLREETDIDACSFRVHRASILAGEPYECKILGSVKLPSRSCRFSTRATTVRPTAMAVPLRVCTACGVSPSAARYLQARRRAWKSVVFEHDVSSRYRSWLGIQASQS